MIYIIDKDLIDLKLKANLYISHCMLCLTRWFLPIDKRQISTAGGHVSLSFHGCWIFVNEQCNSILVKKYVYCIDVFESNLCRTPKLVFLGAQDCSLKECCNVTVIIFQLHNDIFSQVFQQY